MQTKHVTHTELIRILALLALGIVLAFVLMQLWKDLVAILTPLLWGAVIAYLFYPLVEKLQSRGLPRVLSILLVYLFFIGIIVIISLYIVPLLVSEFSALAERIPSYTVKVQQWFDSLQAKFSQVTIPPAIEETLQQNINRIQNSLVALVQRAVQFIIDLFSRMFALILAPVLAFYILKDLEEIRQSVKWLVPKDLHQEFGQIAHRIHLVLGSWLRGQLAISAFIFFMVLLGTRIIGMDYGLVIATISAITNLIPYFGPIIGAVPAVLLALTHSYGMAVKVLVLYVVVQQIESNIVSPQIMGRSIGLHPMAVILALLVGGKLLGVLGLVLAVPIAGIIKVILEYWLEKKVHRC